MRIDATGSPVDVATRLAETIAITTYSTGMKPILTGAVNFPRVELYRSRGPFRRLRAPTYFEGQLLQSSNETVLEGDIVTSAFHTGWFRVITAGWVAVAALMVIAALTVRNWRMLPIALFFSTILGLASYGLTRIRAASIKAESELLEEDIGRALGGERLRDLQVTTCLVTVLAGARPAPARPAA